MKNIGLYFILAVFFLTGLLCSCSDSKQDLPLSLTMSNSTGKDSIFAGDTLAISGIAKAEGKISEIQLFRRYPYSDGGFSEAEVLGTRLSNFSDTTTTFRFSFMISGITSTANFKVQVTDRNGKVVSAPYVVSMRTSNIIRYNGLKMGGWISQYGSCLDVETGNIYGGSKTRDPVIAPLLDVYFEDSKLGNTDLDSMYYNNVNRLRDTGIRFAKTNITPDQFDKLKADDSFVNMPATIPIIAIKTDDVIFFRAKSGKKGLLRIRSLLDPQGDLVLDEIIQK